MGTLSLSRPILKSAQFTFARSLTHSPWRYVFISFLSPHRSVTLLQCFPVLTWHLPWTIPHTSILAIQSLAKVLVLRQSFNIVPRLWCLKTDHINASFLSQPTQLHKLFMPSSRMYKWPYKLYKWSTGACQMDRECSFSTHWIWGYWPDWPSFASS